MHKILELNQILRNRLEDGYDLSNNYDLEELIQLLTDDTLSNFPNQEPISKIKSNINSLLIMFKEGLNGISEIEMLVDGVFAANNAPSAYVY